MRFSAAIVFLAGAIASTSAAHLFARQYPDCATPCITNADIGTCDPSDLGCLCKDQNFIASTTQCIISSCNAADALQAEATARQFCETVGVTLSGTPSVTPTATPSASGSGSSAAASASVSKSGSSAKPSSTAPTSAGASGSSSSASPTASKNAAVSHGSNALLGLAAVGLAAFAL